VPLPPMFNGRLALPAIAAPMFLVSNPDLVVETCRAGLIGTFPALNQRSTEGYEGFRNGPVGVKPWTCRALPLRPLRFPGL
jgi:hypothetical protein